ncbi:pyridoxal 5'-phosphate synthase subunit PdxT [Bacteroidia bacterium]|nr:pyridoxal 5'-phosphate synthase subunit PdxT [Bacteroidia bacterium]GHT47970.1 pyridoxal 5'-phosphate synthase subunit PdxT [Bacteroidia bacterium]
MSKILKIGVLALQGGFIEHIHILQSLQVDTFEIRKKADLSQEMDGLIIPGGESTVIGKLLKDLDMYDDLKEKIEQGLPVFGTCAGMILLAKQIEGKSNACFGAIDITVKRNAYGRQLGSFFTEAEFKGIGIIPMTFIRAPYIESTGPNVEILSVVDEHIVAAREKNVLVTSYHPELTSDNRVHRYFIQSVCHCGLDPQSQEQILI